MPTKNTQPHQYRATTHTPVPSSASDSTQAFLRNHIALQSPDSSARSINKFLLNCNRRGLSIRETSYGGTAIRDGSNTIHSSTHPYRQCHSQCQADFICGISSAFTCADNHGNGHSIVHYGSPPQVIVATAGDGEGVLIHTLIVCSG